MKRARRDDDGAILIMTVAAVLMLFAVAALAVDLSYDYGQRRQQQNAADSGALAGAKQLNTILYSSSTVSTPSAANAALVTSAALTTVVSNDGDPAYFTCKLVYSTGASNTDCSNLSGYPNGSGLYPVGVRVTAGRSHAPFFASAFGTTGLSSPTAASARVSAIKGTDSPFMICGVSSGSSVEHSYKTQTASNGTVYAAGAALPDLLTSASPAVLNGNAVGLEYTIFDSKLDNDCGAGPSFKGAVSASPTVYTIPGLLPTQNGVKNGPTMGRLNNLPACGDVSKGTPYDCGMVVPVCRRQAPGDGGDLYCVTLAAFEIISPSGKKPFYAKLLATDVAEGGYTSSGGAPSYLQARVIQLIE